MVAPELTIVDADEIAVWRVGRAPDPWAWADPQYAGHNRWDDVYGVFRTIYAADSLYACFVEVLAYARPDVEPAGHDLLAGIDEDPQDAVEYPVQATGSVPREWISGRMVAMANLTGPYADVRAAATIAALRPPFLRLALELRYPDFDAAALKSANPRELTQHVASHLYALTDAGGSTVVDGVRFASRHGDELTMWCIFERPGDEPASHHLRRGTSHLVETDSPDLLRAMALHRLSWRAE